MVRPLIACGPADLTPLCRVDDGQASLVKAFESGTGLDKGRSLVAKDLCLKSVATL